MKLRKSAVAAAVIGTTVLGAGTAYAFVVAMGHGTGQATTANRSAVTMDVTVAPVTGLLPGADAQVLPVVVKNTSKGTIRIDSVKLTVSDSCSGTIRIAQPNVPTTYLEDGKSKTFNAAIEMVDEDNVDQTPCLGKAITVNASVNGG